MTNRVTRV